MTLMGAWMTVARSDRRPPRRASRSLVGRVLFTLAAIGLLAMPVEYRGGAEQAHPHVFFQLWIDAAHHSFDHHLARDLQPAAVTMSHPRSQAQPGKPIVGQEPTFRSDDLDAPSLSTLLVPETRGIALMVSGDVLLAMVARGRLPVPNATTLTGSLPRPEAPPPRSIFAL